MTRAFLLLLTLAVPVRAAAPVSLCDVTANPPAYDGKQVEITAFVTNGWENTTLFDPRCEARIWVEYDEGVRRRRAALLHATLRGRFDLGGRARHLGQWSVFHVSEIVSVDPHDVRGVDYDTETPVPEADCFKTKFPARSDLLNEQRAADDGSRAWAFDDPLRVASERVPGVKLRRTHRRRGRQTFEGAGRVVIVSRPYWLSFFAANRKRVAWVVLAVHETGC